MRFHLPSFFHYLDCLLPVNIAVQHHHYVVYLLSAFPLRRDFLQEVVAAAALNTFETPLGTPASTEMDSLIKGLLDPHRETLVRTLQDTDTYIHSFKMADAQGSIARYETHLDVIDIQEICRTVRVQEDSHLIWSLIQHDAFCSVRLTEKKVYLNTGKRFSFKRISDAILLLEQAGLVTKNGRLKTHGREITINMLD